MEMELEMDLMEKRLILFKRKQEMIEAINGINRKASADIGLSPASDVIM